MTTTDDRPRCARAGVRGGPALALSGVLAVVVLASSGCAPLSGDGPSAAGTDPSSGPAGTGATARAAGPIPGTGRDDDGGTAPPMAVDAHHYVGLWVTADGGVRQRLRPDGTYVEARGADESAYTGRYEITGDHIEYWDDSGFTAEGDFRDDVLHHGGMVMTRGTG